ncbi:MAG: Ig-like domain-containing protein [Euryarchaeota archaeon]|nr:Ig-like domain-containing protein [Euryarchaeota archaeon]
MAMKRLNYFKGEFLNKDDFEEEQNYHVDMLRKHNENLHKGGIAAGLEVPETFEDGTAVIGGTDLLIKRGTAIDDSGRQIVLTEDKRITASTIIPAGSIQATFYLIIYYHEEPTDPREDNPGKLENSRVKEEPVITFVEVLQANDPKKPLILATVTLDSNKKITKIDINGRKYASSRIADRSITSIKIDSGAVKKEHLNIDIFNNLLSSPDGTIGIQVDSPNKIIKLTSQVATGVVEFSGFTPSVKNVSGLIDPGFGPGPISVIMGLDETHTSNKQVFIGASEASGFFNLPDVLLGALVDTSTGNFRVGMRVNGTATSPIRVRWWAFKPGQDKGTLVVVSVSIDPFNPSLRPGRTLQFEANVTGTGNKAVDWSVQETDGGSITNTGLYTAPITPGTYHVIATSHADATKSGMTSVAVTEDITVSIAPATARVFAGDQQQFKASVTGSSNPGVTWSVKETKGGTIDNTGLYTAPAIAGTYTVVATSKADNTKTATAQVEVQPKVAVTISPAEVNLFSGKQQQFKANVTGSADTGVIWSVQEGSGGGTIDGTGLYTAPSGIIRVLEPIMAPSISEPRLSPIVTGTGLTPITPPTTIITPITPVLSPGIIGTYHVVATSKADPTKTAVAIVTVTMASVSISPAQVTILPGRTQKFTATVLGVPDTRVNWSTTGGTIDATGLYTAPVTPGTYQVAATSVADSTKTATSSVTVTPGISVSINPASTTVEINKGVQFRANVTGTTNTAVTWRVQETNGGSINTTGLYISPGTPGTYHVVATSVADTTRTATSTVTVTSIKTDLEKLIEKAKDTDKIAKELEKAKDADKTAEKLAKEIETGGGITPIINPGPIMSPEGGSTFDGVTNGRAFIRPEERPDIGTITQPK